MKSVVVREFGAPAVMRIEDVPDPSPGPQQVIVRAKAIGVNPVEVYIRSGTYPRKPTLPYTPGSDAAGVVEAVGAQVTTVKRGDRVYVHGVAAGTGAYSELVVSEEAQVHPLPDGVSFQQGAAMGVPYGTAYRALFVKGQARPGETVFINGASGGVGTAAIQLARYRGLRVIATAGSDRGLALVGEQGAHAVLNHKEDGYIERIPSLTGGKGADVVLEMLANVNLDRDLDVIAMRGRVVVVGNRGTIEINPRKMMGKDGAIIGMTMFNATPEDLRETHAALVAGLECGALKPVVGREVPFADVAKAHEAVMEPGAYGKIVLIA